MTTIAVRDGQMAADTQVTESALALRGEKIVRLPCGGLAGGCGLYGEVRRGLVWLQSGGKGKPPKLTESEILVAYGDGRVGSYSGRWTFMPYRGPAAVGSGAQAALAAMYHYDASAEEAVKAAASVDPNTSGPVDVFRVEPVKAKKRKK